jgi:hypothetical protein
MTFNLISPIGSPILPAAYWLNLPKMVYLSSSPPPHGPLLNVMLPSYGVVISQHENTNNFSVTKWLI